MNLDSSYSLAATLSYANLLSNFTFRLIDKEGGGKILAVWRKIEKTFCLKWLKGISKGGTNKDLSNEAVQCNGVWISVGWVLVLERWMKDHGVKSSDILEGILDFKEY